MHEEISHPAAPRSRSMDNYGPWHNTYLAIYFTLTGLHALHVIGGAVVIGYLWGPGSRMWQTDPERFTNRVEISGLFWHFVDLVWISCFPSYTCYKIMTAMSDHNAHDIRATCAPLPVCVSRAAGRDGADGGGFLYPFGHHALNIAVACSSPASRPSWWPAIFMHLISERKMIYGILAFTAFSSPG